MDMITITIRTGGSAFGDMPLLESARILKELAEEFESGIEPNVIFDYNGNSACKIEYKDGD